MRHTLPDIARMLSVSALFLSALAVVAGADTPTADVEDALASIEAALSMDDLSRELWPHWKISETPFALLGADGTCYLVNHPDPPRTFERVRDTSARISVHIAPSAPRSDRRVCRVEDVPTAIMREEELLEDPLPAIVAAAFAAYEEKTCAGRTDPVILVSGYPAEAEDTVLADIECELLRRAVSASEDSLRYWAESFAGLRRHRRMRMGRRHEEYERGIEFTKGVPAYLADRCREEATAYLGGEVEDRPGTSLLEGHEPEMPPADSLDLDWYRHDRFRWTGEMTCLLLDRLHPEWREEAWEDCTDPYEVLWRQVEGRTPMARVILARFDYENMVARRASESVGVKSDAERHFEDIARNDNGVLSISTDLLAAGEVTFESAGIERIDAHRLIHRRLLKIQYSWGTRFECVGAPVAAILGEDEFDFRRLILRLPDEYSIVVDGEEIVPEPGVYQFEESLRFSAEGLTVEAHAGAVRIIEGGISLTLRR